MLRKLTMKKRAKYQTQFLLWIGDELPVSVPVKPCERCEMEFARGGNGYVGQLVCRSCGRRSKERRDDPTYLDPEQCPHTQLTTLKSTKDIVRIYCRGCCTVIDSMSRADHIQIEADKNKLENASNRVRTNASRMCEGFHLEPKEAWECTKFFGQQVQVYLSQRIGRGVLGSEMHTLLQDCLDRYRHRHRLAVAPTQSSGSAEQTTNIGSAFRIDEWDGSSAKTDPETLDHTAFVAYSCTEVKTQYDSRLKIVNIQTSPYLWAVIDTACNASVMSTGWMKNKMIPRLGSIGMGCRWVKDLDRLFGGLAGSNTARLVGEVAWPFVVTAEKNFASMLGTITNVVDGSANFLLGLDLQRALCLTLKIPKGTCSIRDLKGNKHNVERCQVEGSGLLCIRIDNFEEPWSRGVKMQDCVGQFTLNRLKSKAMISMSVKTKEIEDVSSYSDQAYVAGRTNI